MNPTVRIRDDMTEQKPIDENLLKALTKAYQARAQLFHNGIKASKIDFLISEIDSIDCTQFQWDLENLGISNSAFERVKSSGSLPHQVFAHPEVICNRPHLIAYYRNVVTISKKGIGQILFSTERHEAKKPIRWTLKPPKRFAVYLTLYLAASLKTCRTIP